MILRLPKMLFEKAGGDGGAGGGGDPAPWQKEIADLKASNAALLERVDKLLGAKNNSRDDKDDDDADDDGDLNKKANRQRADNDKKASDAKATEAAIRFSLQAPEFLKTHEALLPKDAADIFKAAETEKYSTVIQKDAAIKAGLIKSFFSVQTNMDLLTESQKARLTDYLALTKDEKQARAQDIYDSIFEPTFDALKRIKKAEAVNRGYGNESDVDAEYKKRLQSGSRKHYLGEKQ